LTPISLYTSIISLAIVIWHCNSIPIQSSALQKHCNWKMNSLLARQWLISTDYLPHDLQIKLASYLIKHPPRHKRYRHVLHLSPVGRIYQRHSFRSFLPSNLAVAHPAWRDFEGSAFQYCLNTTPMRKAASKCRNVKLPTDVF
jgi:hypothetical protein